MSFQKTSVLGHLIYNSARTIANSKSLICQVSTIPEVVHPCCILEYKRSYCARGGSKEKALSTNSNSVGLSKAMRAYLERAQEEERFMSSQISEFEIGKRHLANMMGENPETFTQKDIDEAIAYLLPSGIHNPPARPFMRHPYEIFPRKRIAEFDESGRPFHSLYYTGRAYFYQVMQDIAAKAMEMDQSPHVPNVNKKNYIAASTWVSKLKFEKIIVDKVSDDLFEFFIRSMERLLQHPNINYDKDEEFFMKFRLPIKSDKKGGEIPQLMYTDEGVPYMKDSQRRKMAFADVTVYGKGSGKFTINGQNILYFSNPQDREQILFPLQFTSLLGLVDVEATVEGGGTTGQSGSIRYATSICLRSFVDADTREKMRLAGLLTRDLRQVERMRPGRRGARALPTWKAR